jgi:PAS domain S-box-containing protein
VLTRGEDLAAIAPDLLATLCENLAWRTATLWLDAADGATIAAAGIWTRDGRLEPWRSATTAAAFRPGEGLPGRAWASGRAVWIRDLATDGNFPRREAARRARLRHGVAFPAMVDGRTVAVIECFGDRIRNDDQRLVRFLEAVGDQLGSFFERSQSRRALLEGETRKAAVLQAAVDAIVMADDMGRIVEFSPAAEQMFGYTAAEVIGCSIADVLVPPESRDDHLAGLGRYLETGIPEILGKRVRTAGLRSDGSRLPVELTVTQTDVSDRPVFTAFIRDRTEQLEAEVARERFLEILSHELRTPVTAIYGGAKMLDRPDMSSSTRRELSADISAEADRLYRLVEDLIVLARAERRAADVILEPVHLEHVVKQVVSSHQAEWPQIQVRVRTSGAGPAVMGDETYVGQVLRNLLSNAAKYAGGGPVDVLIEQGLEEAQVRVLDDGPGIESAEASRLFEIGYRSPSTKRLAGGSGIGLFVARWLIQAMEGRIWARRREEGGTEFAFALQLVRDEGAGPQPAVIGIGAELPSDHNGPPSS